MGGPPRAPKPDPAPKLPSVSDPAVADAARKKRVTEANSRGRKSTILTGTSGFEETSLKKKTLLGA